MCWLETLLGSGAEPRDETHLRVLEGAGTLRGWQKDYEPGRAFLMEALQLAQERADHGAIPRILAWLGWIFRMNGKTEEAAWLAERLETCHTDVDPWDLAYAYLSLGSLLYEAGLDREAGKAFTRSLEPFQFAEENYTAIYAESKLALLKHKKGDIQEAKKGMMGALEAARQSNELTVIAYCVDDTAQLTAQRLAEQNAAQKQDLEKMARVLGAVDHWRELTRACVRVSGSMWPIAPTSRISPLRRTRRTAPPATWEPERTKTGSSELTSFSSIRTVTLLLRRPVRTRCT